MEEGPPLVFQLAAGERERAICSVEGMKAKQDKPKFSFSILFFFSWYVLQLSGFGKCCLSHS